MDSYSHKCKDRSRFSRLPEPVIAEHVAKWNCGIEAQDIKQEIGYPERKEARRKIWEGLIMIRLLQEEIDGAL